MVGEDYLQPWKNYLKADQSLPFGSLQYYKKEILLLGPAGHGLTLAPQQ